VIEIACQPVSTALMPAMARRVFGLFAFFVGIPHTHPRVEGDLHESSGACWIALDVGLDPKRY
jgi:hypothetical protein